MTGSGGAWIFKWCKFTRKYSAMGKLPWHCSKKYMIGYFKFYKLVLNLNGKQQCKMQRWALCEPYFVNFVWTELSLDTVKLHVTLPLSPDWGEVEAKKGTCKDGSPIQLKLPTNEYKLLDAQNEGQQWKQVNTTSWITRISPKITF